MSRIQLDLPEKVDYTTDITLAISDMNYGNHLSNDKVLTLAHEARIRFLEHFGWSEFDIEGSSIIMADAAVVYKSEGFRGNKIEIQVAVDDIGNSGFDLYYRMVNLTTGKDLAHVKTGILCFDYETRKVRRLPDVFANRFKKKK